MTGEVQATDLAARLRRAVQGTVSDGARRRAEYSSDAGNYRVLPLVVVEPMDVDDVLATLDVSRDLGVPVVGRGGGTSIAGNAVGPGIVIDFARHLNRIVEIDSSSRTALVQPGVILSDLQRRAAALGLRFGPDPSSQNRASIGGMIGNNACGPHAVAYGRTADNVRALTVVDGQGRLIRTADGPQRVPKLGALVDAHLDVLRTEFGRFPRQISGYSLEHLLPERGRDLAKALVGSEGTLALTLDATIGLVPISPARLLVVLGYPDMASAADAVPAVLAHAPLAVEGLDARLVDVVRIAKGSAAVPDLPHGAGWLMVEVGGTTPAEARSSALSMVRDAAALDHAVLEPGPAATALWQIRADGAGLAGRTPDGRQAWPGWEDAAVPPARLGAYLREFEALMASYGVVGLPYGHFGDGCIHVRIDLPLEHDAEVFRRFIVDAARLVVAHGGSCSGEHGDGRARSELLSMMYSDRARQLFADVKAVFDPRDLLNPGVLVRPDPIDAHLRRPQAKSLLATDGFSFSRDAGDFTTAVHRCVGVGSCRADTGAAGGFMCPSYLASGDEKDVTRGRARVLQELTNGALIDDWTSAEVHESLDLCLSCKACASDCPAGVDMAQYKVGGPAPHVPSPDPARRSLQHGLAAALDLGDRCAARIRAFGDQPTAVIPAIVAGPVAVGRYRLPSPGTDIRRCRFPPAPSSNAQRISGNLGDGRRSAARGAVGRLVHRRAEPGGGACCRAGARQRGLPGDRARRRGLLRPDLDHHRASSTAARKRLLRLIDVLEPYAAKGIPIVALEPSCCAVLRSDLVELMPDDPRAVRVARAVTTMAELLTRTNGWRPPDLSGTRIIVQPHCHQHAVMGFAADRALLEQSAAEVTVLAGCCGLAGNFGMEKGHYEMSLAVAENALLPALRGGQRAPSCWPTDSPAGCRWISWRGCGGSACPSCSRRTCRSTHRSSTDPQHRRHRSSGSSVPVR